jgi:hypothetical protein
VLWDRRPQVQVALCFLLLAVTFAENGVHIRSKYNQLVTSSTLRWIGGMHGSHPENAVIGAREIVEGTILNCNSRSSGL